MTTKFNAHRSKLLYPHTFNKYRRLQSAYHDGEIQKVTNACCMHHAKGRVQFYNYIQFNPIISVTFCIKSKYYFAQIVLGYPRRIRPIKKMFHTSQPTASINTYCQSVTLKPESNNKHNLYTNLFCLFCTTENSNCENTYSADLRFDMPYVSQEMFYFI